MRSKSDLFRLIQSLSKSEKRYFVLDAKKSGRSASRYLRLFEAINQMETCDEAALQKKFPGNLPADKAYLYESILRSMRDYAASSSKAVRVKERLVDARYLFERGLYDQSSQRLQEAKAMATKLQDPFTLLEINREEFASLFDRKAAVELEQLDQLTAERQHIMASIAEELQYLDLYYRLLLEVLKDFNLKDAQSLDELRRRLPLHLLDAGAAPTSPQALRRHYLCNAVYYHLAGDPGKVYHYSLKAVEWWDDYPCLKEEEFHRYIINVSNLLNTMYKTPHAPQARQWLDKLNDEKPSKSFHNEKVIFTKLSIGNLLYLLNANQFEAAHQMLPQIVTRMNKFGLRKSMVLCGNIATVHFLVGDYKNCIQWADFVARQIKSGSRQDIQRIVRIYKLISLYELGEVEALDAGIRAVSRYFTEVSLAANAFEQVLLSKYLKPIFTSPVNQARQYLKALLGWLDEVQHDNQNSPSLGLTELVLWANKCLGHGSGRQVIKPDDAIGNSLPFQPGQHHMRGGDGRTR